MEYEDYKVLSEEEYNFLSEQYLSQKQPKNYAQFVCDKLEVCKNMCLTLTEKTNTNVATKIKGVFDYLQNIKDNLLATFSIKSATICEVKNFNIFSLLTATFDVLNALYNWQNEETKQHTKIFLTKTINSLTERINLLLTALENSNILTFKHM